MISKSFLIFKNEQKNKIYSADGFVPDGFSGPFSDLVRPHSRKNYKMGVTVGTMQLVPEQPFPLA